jgi:hypothetical protein
MKERSMRIEKYGWLLVSVLVMAGGCAGREGAYAPVGRQDVAVENREKFVLLDKATRDSVDCSGLLERRLEDGRMEVVAQVRNRLNRRIEVQVNCVFKDKAGFPTEDEASFRTLILTENAQEGVRFASLNTAAADYTVRIRQAR